MKKGPLSAGVTRIERDRRRKRFLYDKVRLWSNPPARDSEWETRRFEAVLKKAILTKEEKISLRMRFLQNQSLDEIGKRLHVSRERARKIEESALQKLRMTMIRQDIDSFMKENAGKIVTRGQLLRCSGFSDTGANNNWIKKLVEAGKITLTKRGGSHGETTFLVAQTK